MQKSIHEPVLLHETIELLAGGSSAREGSAASSAAHTSFPWYLDCTLGGAGHAQALFERFNHRLNVIGLDRDPQAVERARELFANSAAANSAASKTAPQKPSLIFDLEDFRKLDAALDRHGIAKVDMILMDLGISSDELDTSGRGFSFLRDEPLQMTLGDPATYAFTAKDIVNSWEEDIIANIIFGYAEERFARRIARAIVRYRTKEQIETSSELAEIIKSAVPAFYRRGKIHPATKTFQALRIAVNDELNALREGLDKAFNRLAPHGRLAVISFHSLEDRIVKEFFKSCASSNIEPATILTKKPLTAGSAEIERNPRARSAKLRGITKD